MDSENFRLGNSKASSSVKHGAVGSTSGTIIHIYGLFQSPFGSLMSLWELRGQRDKRGRSFLYLSFSSCRTKKQ